MPRYKDYTQPHFSTIAGFISSAYEAKQSPNVELLSLPEVFYPTGAQQANEENTKTHAGRRPE